MTTNELRQALVTLSHEIGREDRQLAILGEGNTSATAGDGTFWVKASGSQLGTITEAGFTQVKMDAILDLVERDQMTQEEVQAIWPEVMVDPQQKRPSVETFLHALCLSEGGASWVAHTHPIACNAILCSMLGAFQFAPGFRARHRTFHRRSGRALIPLALVVALTGLWMTHFYPWPAGDGMMVYVERLIVGVAMLVFIVRGVQAIRCLLYTSPSPRD